MSEHEYHQRAAEIVQRLLNGEATIEIQTLAGREQLTVKWVKINAVAGIDNYFIAAADQRGHEVAEVDYKVDHNHRPPRATIENRSVERAYRRKGVSRQLFGLLAQHVRSLGVEQIGGWIRKTNQDALNSRQRMRDLLTGQRYRTTLQKTSSPQFWDVTTFLNQFADDEGESV